MSNGGWGKQPWGASGWGGMALSPGGIFAAVAAYAPAENILRILFSQAPYFSGIFDVFDASDPSHYSVQPIVGTTGNDGYSARPVAPVQAVLSTQAPNAVDVYLDRPMSPFPAQYALVGTNLAPVGLGGAITSVGFQVLGVYRQLQPQHEDVALPTRDLANPQTISAIQGSGLSTLLGPSNTVLGVFQVDDSGDYAFDAGIQTVKKRILRRGITDKGAFAHLPRSYGVGLLSACKRLGIPSVRDKYAADYAAQILQEPEVVAATVTAIQDPNVPSLIHFVIRAQTRTGTSLSFDHPMDTVRGISLAQAA